MQINASSWQISENLLLRVVDKVNSWLAAPAELDLGDDEIHVWALSLKASPGRLGTLAGTLSSDEKERAEKFSFDLHRNRFIAGRGFLREILGRYLRADPAALDFVYSSHGKPSLARRYDSLGLHFNLAHTEDAALVAVTRIAPLGVDLEFVRPISEMDDLVAQFFSTSENTLFQKVPACHRLAAFFNLWTRKEALLKATGDGIGRFLPDIEVSFLPDEPACVRGICGNSEKATSWTLYPLSLPPGLLGTLAIQARNLRVRCWKTDHP